MQLLAPAFADFAVAIKGSRSLTKCYIGYGENVPGNTALMLEYLRTAKI